MANAINREEAFLLLPTKDAKAFVHDKLGVQDFDDKFACDKIQVLEEIILAWQGAIPFQTVTQMALMPEQRSAPSMKENLELILTLQGGRCYTMNTVMHVLLTSLGFDARLTVGSVHTPGMECHALVLLKGLTSASSTHLVDVGFGNFMPKAICLDFAEESEVVEGINKPYKYIKSEDYFVLCQQVRGSESFPPEVIIKNGWAQTYYFSQRLEERSYAQLQKSIGDSTYKNMDHFFNKDIYCVQCTNGCVSVLRNMKLVVEQAPGKAVTKTTLQSEHSFCAAVARHFPSLPEATVQQAMKNCKDVQLAIQNAQQVAASHNAGS